jgi:hypothetical protein
MMEMLRAVFYFLAAVALACYVATFIMRVADDWRERRRG